MVPKDTLLQLPALGIIPGKDIQDEEAKGLATILPNLLSDAAQWAGSSHADLIVVQHVPMII